MEQITLKVDGAGIFWCGNIWGFFLGRGVPLEKCWKEWGLKLNLKLGKKFTALCFSRLIQNWKNLNSIVSIGAVHFLRNGLSVEQIENFDVLLFSEMIIIW